MMKPQKAHPGAKLHRLMYECDMSVSGVGCACRKEMKKISEVQEKIHPYGETRPLGLS
jgi:hypothetical protein